MSARASMLRLSPGHLSLGTMDASGFMAAFLVFYFLG